MLTFVLVDLMLYEGNLLIEGEHVELEFLLRLI